MNIYQQKKQHIRTWPTIPTRIWGTIDQQILAVSVQLSRWRSPVLVQIFRERAQLLRFFFPRNENPWLSPSRGSQGLQRGGKERCWKYVYIYTYISDMCNMTWQPLWKYRVIKFVFVMVLLSIDPLVHQLLIITEMVRMLPKRLVKPTGVRTMYSIETGIKQTWNDSEAFPNLSRKIIYLETWPIQETKSLGALKSALRLRCFEYWTEPFTRP